MKCEFHLGGYVRMLNIVLQMRHHHEVTGFIPAIMYGMEVNMVQNGMGSQTVS